MLTVGEGRPADSAKLGILADALLAGIIAAIILKTAARKESDLRKAR